MTNIQRYRLLRIAMVATLAAITLIVASIANAQGDFALQPGSHNVKNLAPPRAGRLVTVAQLNLPGIEGMTVRGRRWDKSEKPWPLIPFIDSCQATVKKAGDRWTLLICSGDQADFTKGSNVAVWERLIAQLGERYGDDPFLWGVHLTGASPFGVSEERHHKITPAIEAADKRLIVAWAKAFRDKKLLLAIGNKDDAGMKRLVKFAVDIAPGRVVVKHNSMKANTSISANHNQLVIWAAKNGAEIGFEMVGSTKESRFGGTYPQMMAKVAQVEKLAGRKVSYLATYVPDLAKVGGLK
jgi:hypothetical protein